MQLLPDPALSQVFFVRGHVGNTLLACFIHWVYGVERCLRSEHAAFHCIVSAFDFGNVDEAGRTSDEGAPREVQFWQRLYATFVEHSCAVRNALPAFQQGREIWVMFEFLWRGITGSEYNL